MRYLRQRDSFRCGPIAIYNILRWAGVRKIGKHWLSGQSVKGYLSKISKTNSETGTQYNEISDVLYRVKRLEFRRISQVGVNYFKIIRKHLKDGHAVIVHYNIYDWTAKEWTQHYAVANNFKDTFLSVINAYYGDTEILFTWKEFRELISVGPFYGVCWLVEKV